ncbi:glycoside hydrolase family 2 protein [Compostibacter hankyongensis]
MAKYLLAAGMLLVTLSLRAQQSTRLTGGWEFLKGDLGGVWEAVRPVTAGSPESVPLWDSVALPHCFNARDAVDPDQNYYEGPGWYRTQLQLKNPYKNGRILLHFEGAGQKTNVYVYTQEVATHTGGYDEWTVDITDAVKAFTKSPDSKRFKGRVPLEIRCDNSRDLQMIPSDMSDFTVHGGLYRYLNLVYVPALSLDEVHILPRVDAGGSTGTVQISTAFRNPDHLGEAVLRLKIKDPQGKMVREEERRVQPQGEMQKLLSFTVNKPQLWSPSDPALYTVEAVLLSPDGTQQTRQETFGFRQFTFMEHGPFMLNGKRLLLRGTHRHQDGAGVGAAETEAMIRREMLLIKAMGVNFIRLAHYQQSPLVLHLCDSLGILVWEELAWCRGGLGGETYKTQARRMLTNMINQHYNHPAVIIWSLGNENDWPGDFAEFDRQKIRAFMKELNDLAHRLDSSRLTAIRRCDFCKDIVDVYSPSIWAGWYSGRYTEYRDATEKWIRQVPRFLHAEWGADSHARRHAEDPYARLGGIPTGQGVAEKAGDAALSGGKARASRDGDWSETYQCDLIDWYLQEQERMPDLTGSAYWIFKDFATPLRPDNPLPYVNQKGVVERDLRPKEAYYVFQSYWSDQPMVHIYGHTWPTRWGAAGKKETVKVYSNCAEAELFVNGRSYGRKKRDSHDFPAAGLRWELPMQEGDYTLRVVARKGRVTVTDSIAFHYQTAQWGSPARLSLRQVNSSGDTATVEATLTDSHGIPCLDARNVVRFGLTGDGVLLDDLGTSDGSRKLELYNGRALIRMKKQGGRSVISISSRGIPSAFLDLSSGSR